MRLADIERWSVYFVPMCQHTNPPKDKYVVIAHIAKAAFGFFINSRHTTWMQKRPNLLVCAPTIHASEHTFLRYDSIVNCDTLYKFLDSDINKKLGELSRTAKSDILQAIHSCPILEREHKKLILSRENYPGYET